ncbi:hypothetical protein [Amycolatopsis sulphurea]|uniref:hypothetical protein n=1 Tax=Amycolatopsis sulphurea TaxID=76022 RepID=UPI001FEA6883|nr:hypothetical protein [Amycolatopsis sulphurea]
MAAPLDTLREDWPRLPSQDAGNLVEPGAEHIAAAVPYRLGTRRSSRPSVHRATT